MTKNPPNPILDLPKGIQRAWQLPDPELGEMWESIIMDDVRKDQLLAQAVLNFTVRPKVARTVLPLHGVILLVGPPGTGKTTLAKGLAHRVAESFKTNKMKLLEVEPHALTSSALGKTQKAVSDLFSQSIAEAAAEGPVIVLLDEVETLAADRSKLSLEANPIDVHRATDAVLVQLDLLADRFTNLLFVATSNFPEAVDGAFMSRCDLVMEVPLPDKKACEKILRECIAGLATTFKELSDLASSAAIADCASECVGLDGRTVRKAVASAIASTPARAMQPGGLTAQELAAALKYAKTQRQRKGGKA